MVFISQSEWNMSRSSKKSLDYIWTMLMLRCTCGVEIMPFERYNKKSPLGFGIRARTERWRLSTRTLMHRNTRSRWWYIQRNSADEGSFAVVRLQHCLPLLHEEMMGHTQTQSNTFLAVFVVLLFSSQMSRMQIFLWRPKLILWPVTSLNFPYFLHNRKSLHKSVQYFHLSNKLQND